MKPVGSVAATVEGVSRAIATKNPAELTRIPGDVKSILAGNKEYSFTQMLREDLPAHPVAATILGTLTDIGDNVIHHLFWIKIHDS